MGVGFGFMHSGDLVVAPPPASGVGAGGAAAALAADPPALVACSVHACRQVMCMLYLSVGALTWALAQHRSPGRRRRPRRRGDGAGGGVDALEAALVAGLARGVALLAAWWALTSALPRPRACGDGLAARASWGLLEGLYPD
jgi:hypothetical protein